MTLRRIPRSCIQLPFISRLVPPRRQEPTPVLFANVRDDAPGRVGIREKDVCGLKGSPVVKGPSAFLSLLVAFPVLLRLRETPRKDFS